MTPLVALQDISKGFPGVQALDGVSLVVEAGEIHAVVGENGAGKSTLINILAGELQPDSGRILYLGEPRMIPSPFVSQQLGISVVYQELALCPNLTVAENISLSATSRQAGMARVQRNAFRSTARTVLERLGMGHLDLDAVVGRLAVAEQQIVEIAKAISTDLKLLVLDEPNSALTTDETARLFAVLRQLRSEGVGILYVSHRLEEVLELADRITVLRDGHYVETVAAADASVGRLIGSMVGRAVDSIYRRTGASTVGEAVALQVRNLSSPPFLNDISFDLHEGEVLGIAGLPNAGKEELVDCCFGLRRYTGEIVVQGRTHALHAPHAAIAQGVALIPADRRGSGALLTMGVQENIVAASLKRVSRAGMMQYAAVRKAAAAGVHDLDIKTPSVSQRMATLSGGNQQKVILARGLFTQARVLILHEPTRGIDVGAKAEIYAILRRLAEDAAAVLIVSSELPELMGQCDRILVLYKGRITGVFARDEFAEEPILACAMGQATYGI